MNAKKINANNRNIIPGEGVLANTMVKAGDFNPLVDDVAALEARVIAIEPATGTLTVDVLSEETLNHGIIADGVTLKDSGIIAPAGLIAATGYIAGIIPFAQPDALSTSGTNQDLGLTKYFTVLTSTGTADKISIPVTGVTAGVIVGQLKKVKYGAEGAGGDTIILTPSVTTGFATCTFNAVNDYVVLMFNGAYWQVIENSGCTLA